MPAQELRDAAYPAETEQVLATLLTLEHEDLAEAIRITDCGEDIVYGADLVDANGNVAALAGTYANLPIEISAPGESDEQGSGKVRIPNIDLAIGELIDSIATPMTVTVAVVLASDPSVILHGPHKLLELVNVQGDALLIEGDIRRPMLTQEVYPTDWVRPSVFRAAYRISS